MLRALNRESPEARATSAAPFWGGGLFGVGWGLAAALTGLAVYLASSAPGSGPIGPVNRSVLILLGLNLALILFLFVSAGHRLLGPILERARDAGARLHLRFVMLFALVAVVPAIVVALVYGALVTRAVENWFSHRVQAVVELELAALVDERGLIGEVHHRLLDEIEGLLGLADHRADLA